ncbi:MAG: PASTA domain-containing protein [Pyrinomonadaceae bacterium]
MDNATGALSALRRLGIVIAVAIVFVLGLATTVYLSLRSPEVKVPDVVGKDRFDAEHVLGSQGLKFRVRATRPSNQLKADTVLFQVPRPGEVVKVGQTVAMDISRTAKEGETSEAVAPEKKPEEKIENRNTNEAASANENKPKRNKNTNKNASENSNGNTGNRNANSNRPATNKNTNAVNSNRVTNLNSNRPALNGNSNSNRSVNQNGTVRPPLVRPSPIRKPSP